MSSRKEEKERAREARLAREAELAAAARRQRRLKLIGGGGCAVIVAIVAVIAIASSSGSGSSASLRLSKLGSAPKLKLSSLVSLGALRSPGPLGSVGPEGIPVPGAPALAGTSAMATGDTVDGIGCLGQEQTLFHIHAHLAIFIDGAPRQVPYAIGITNAQSQSTPQGTFVGGGSGSCFYWLHTHAADGILHIESPAQRTFTLGDFFDIWGQPLGPRQVGPAFGPVTAMYNGQLYVGNPRDIPLNAHAQIQLDVGKPLVGPESISFGNI